MRIFAIFITIMLNKTLFKLHRVITTQHSISRYFNHDSKHFKGQRTLNLNDIIIPQHEIRQFVKIVHPDRFEIFINRNNNDTMYKMDQLKKCSK